MESTKWTQYLDAIAIGDSQAGYAGIRVYRVSFGQESLAASVLFWDAEGHFYVQTVEGGVPVDILEAAIAEAKQKVKIK
jgi:hypothetical protein